MKNALELFLGILTAMGGFVEIGELLFTVNGGAKFGFRLMWVVLLGTGGIIVFGEMAGRVAASAHKPVFKVIKEQIGYKAGLGTLVAANLVNLLTCAAEIGGAALILKLLFGTNYFAMVVVSFLFLLAVIWFLSLQHIERVFGLLGLLMIVFIFTAVWSQPEWTAVAAGLVPNIPREVSNGEIYSYLYFVVALMSSIMLPYETYFYSSGAIEDNWTADDVPMNRIIVLVGFSLGGLLAAALLIVGATVYGPRLIEPQLPGTVALAPAMYFGKIGLLVGLLGMFFAIAGAAIETCLAGAYNIAQFQGWFWGKQRGPRSVPQFTASWVIILTVAMLIIITGIDPVEVVEYSIIFAVVILPLTYYPLLIAANHKRSMKEHVNGRLSNTLGWLYFAIITIAALAAIPLMILSHSGKT
jgi:manganese transport protein